MKSSALPGCAQGRDGVVLGPAWSRGIPARAGLSSCNGLLYLGNSPETTETHLFRPKKELWFGEKGVV